MRPTAFLPLLLLFAPATPVSPDVEGLREGETARETDDYFPGAIPGDENGGAAWIVTRVIDLSTGEPIPGAHVDAIAERTHPTPARWEPVRRAVADEHGWARMRFDDLRAAVNWYSVSAVGYADWFDSAPPESVTRLRPGVDVEVEVRDGFDRPVPDAHLGLILGCGHTPDVREAVTDAVGRAVLRDVEPGRGELWFTKVGFRAPRGSLDLPDLAPRGALAPIVRVTAASWARGVLLDFDGRPAGGVVVGSPDRHRGPWTRTDDEGNFLLTGLAFWDEVTFLPTPDDSRAPRSYSDAPPPGMELELRLPPPGEEYLEPMQSVEISVMEEGTGRPAGGVLVHAIRRVDPFFAAGKTNGGGIARLFVPDGAYDLIVEPGAGAFATARGELKVEEGVGDEPRLEVGARPTLRLHLERFPAPARWKQNRSRTSITLVTSRGDRDVTDLAWEGTPVPVPETGEYAFLVRVGGRERVVFGPEDRGIGELTLRAPLPHEVRARLADAEGNPVSGRVIVARRPDWEERDAAETAAHAWRVSTWYAERPVYLVAHAAEESGLRDAIVEVALPAGEGKIVDIGEVRLSSHDDPPLRIRYADGTPAAHADILVENYNVFHTTEVDEAGNLDDAATPLQGARVRVSDYEERFLPFRARLDGPRPWTLVVPDGRLALEVSDEVGDPLYGFTILVDGAMVTTKGATHEVRGVSAGEHEVVVCAPGRRAHVMQMTFAEGETRELKLTLSPASR